MSILIPGRFIYLAAPRTASNAICKFLLENFPDAMATHRHHDLLYRGLRTTDTIMTKMVGNEIIFTSVRNHYEAIKSWYANVRGFDVENYQRYEYRRGGDLWWMRHYADTIVKYENLESDLELILGIPVSLEEINVTYRSVCLSDLTYNKIYELFGKEMRDLGYA